MATVGSQVGNETDIVGWQPNPLTRGTADILTGCLITLALCIWSALHINVAGKDGWYARVWAKIFWALLCLVAPEVVAAIAWNQRKQASQLAKHMNDELGLPPPPGFWARCWTRIRSLPNHAKKIKFWGKKRDREKKKQDEEAGDPAADPSFTERKHSWTLKHAFFARMGGFGLYIPPLPDHMRFLPQDKPDDTYLITPAGIELLAKYPEAHKDIPDISKDEIDAMSRASAFAKFIVCGQAIWFICQVLIRLIQHLPISLLELNTVAHAICVLLTFVYWWDKPFDVERPHYLQSRFLHPAAAAKQMEQHTTDVAELWFAKAHEYLVDQEARFELLSNWVNLPLRPRPCKDLAAYLRNPLKNKETWSNIYNFITFYRKAVVDDAAFVHFCTQEHSQDTGTISPTTSVSWATEIEGTKFSLAATVSEKYLKTLSPLQYPGYPYHNWLKVLQVTFAQQGSDALIMVLAVVYSPLILIGLLIILIIPQTRKRELSTWRHSGLVEDIFASKWLTRKERDGSPPDQPRTIREFLALSDPVVQMKTSDVVLLQTAWHCVQYHQPDCLKRLRQSEWSSADLSWHFRSDAGFFASFALFTAVYGGLHFIGLRAPFRSSTDQVVWEISSILVTAGILAAGLIVYPALWTWRRLHPKISPRIKSYLSTRLIRRRVFEELTTLMLMGVMMLCATALFAYLVARFALVVECFISLTHQPRNVYTVRPWAAYWPHIS